MTRRSGLKAWLLAAMSACYANADAARDYIDKIPWSVDVISPKLPFVGMTKGEIVPGCNLGVIDILARALFLDEPRYKEPADTANERDQRHAMAVAQLGWLEKLLNMVESMLKVSDKVAAGTETTTFTESMTANHGLPIVYGRNATPEGKIRLLATSFMFIQHADPVALKKVLRIHDALETEEEKIKFAEQMYTLSAERGEELGRRTAEHKDAQQESVTSGLLEKLAAAVGFDDDENSDTDNSARSGIPSMPFGLLPDDAYMDLIPDTMVGFFSSRTVMELFAEVFTDSWGAGVLHDANRKSVGHGLCRAIALGPVDDFAPVPNGCALLSAVWYILGCSRASGRTRCGAYVPPKYGTCDKIPQTIRDAAIKPLSYIPMKDAIDTKTDTLTKEAVEKDGPTYSFLQQATLANDDLTGQHWCLFPISDSRFRMTHLDGWDIIHEIMINEENDLTSELAPLKTPPLITMSKRQQLPQEDPSQCEFLVVTRGTNTGWEWALDVQVGYVPLPGLSSEYLGHSGYAKLASHTLDSINGKLLKDYFHAPSARKLSEAHDLEDLYTEHRDSKASDESTDTAFTTSGNGITPAPAATPATPATPTTPTTPATVPQTSGASTASGTKPKESSETVATTVPGSLPTKPTSGPTETTTDMSTEGSSDGTGSTETTAETTESTTTTDDETTTESSTSTTSRTRTPPPKEVCDPGKSTVWFAGHSLGGGMSNMQSLLFAQKWKSAYPTMKVNMMGLASPRVFTEKTRALHADLVNSRNFRFEYDIIANVPCTNTGVLKCDPKFWPLSLNGEGYDPKSAEPNGLVVLEGKRDFQDVAKDLQAFNDQRFISLPTYELIAAVLNTDTWYLNFPISLQIAAAHTCSYHCYISSNFCASQRKDQIECVRMPKESSNPDVECSNKPPAFGDLYGTGVDRLTSIDCTKRSDAADLPKDRTTHVCTSFMNGMSGSQLLNIVQGLMGGGGGIFPARMLSESQMSNDIGHGIEL